MDQSEKIRKIEQVREVFGFYRMIAVDMFEQDLGNDKNWPVIRSRILKLMSPERGLEAKVVEILKGTGGGLNG